MSYEPIIHTVQASILRQLLFTPRASFVDLQKETNLSSDHFTFHIKKLIESGLIEKNASQYQLTLTGKEYANRMDTDSHVIERQPKVSTLLIVERTLPDGTYQYLVQQRLKQPFYGFWGLFGGKVGWGESFEDTAERELKEESGLDGTFVYKFLHRKRDYKKSDNSLLEDKVFAVMFCDNASGTLKTEFEGGHNEWVTIDSLRAKDNYFSDAPLLLEMAHSPEQYIAKDYFYTSEEY